ncbi:MAG: hypothetical protein K6E29_05750 [Cyanobacteria bacterium RUI128]|nr:hypothetical protein [Cyanobacteria bacterium RUI128]
MIFFIAIVFISELIILFTVVNLILKTDRRVRVLTRYIDRKRARLKWNLMIIKEITEDICGIIPLFLKALEKTKMNIAIRILNEGLQGSVLLFFKPKYKKLLLAFKTGFGVSRKLLKI